MRAFKYRAKDMKGKWVYGSVVKSVNNSYFIYSENYNTLSPDITIINKHTINQMVCKLENGHEIYEGDMKMITSDVLGGIEFEAILVYISEYSMFGWLGFNEWAEYLEKGIDSLDPAEFWLYPFNTVEANEEGLKIIGNLIDTPQYENLVTNG